VRSDNQDSPSGESQSSDQPSKAETQAADIASKLEPPPSEPKHPETCDEKKHWLDYVTFGLELVGLIVLCTYAAYTIKIYYANQSSADAAKSAAETAHDSLVLSNRPWLGIDGSIAVLEPLTVDKDGLHARVGFHIKNFGPGPALHIGTDEVIRNSADDVLPDGTVSFANFKREADVSCRMADAATKPIVPDESGSGPYIFPNNSHLYESNLTTSPAPKQVTRLDIVGCITYADQFKVIHHTRFCFMGQKSITDTKVGDVLMSCPINQNAD
jgi:hypothetical protein